MTNQNSSGIGIPASSALFTILAFGIGALILLASNIDPRAGIRAQFTPTPTITPTPLDLFANINFVRFVSPDGLVEFDRPEGWTELAAQQQPFTYIFAPVRADGSSADISRFEVILFPIRELGSASLTAESTPEEILREIASVNVNAQASAFTPVQIGGFSGASVTLSQMVTNQGQSEERLAQFIVLSLGEGYIAVIDAITTRGNATRMEGVMQQVQNTFKLNHGAALEALDATFGTPTAEPTAESTTETPVEATQPATSAVTPEATPAP